MKILFVEDDLNKLKQLQDLLREHFPDAEQLVALSFQSGQQELAIHKPDIVILDMQLPTFDKTPSEDGGRRRSLAGKELLRQLLRRKLSSIAVIVTQWREFDEDGKLVSLDELRHELISMRIPNYKGLVYYHPNLSSWKDELILLIKTKR